jgi:hypothetical protein
MTDEQYERNALDAPLCHRHSRDRAASKLDVTPVEFERLVKSGRVVAGHVDADGKRFWLDHELVIKEISNA